METFRTFAEMKTEEGLTIAVVGNEKSYDTYIVKALGGPNGHIDLFETERATPADRNLAERVMKAAHAAAEEAELAMALAPATAA